jgi:DNA invertase Pin-like site-specific DNA recombinase
MSDIVKKLRCAIYTRKSTSEGLDQDFNSLDAQREACQSYILAQRGEGWIAIQSEYNDGGFSGGNINRPALQKLLNDIRDGLIDCVVCYKIDRISRSLADFVGLVKLFDIHGVTFVSITQSFNTTTSMGRLTLNILLSFGQFERELAGERVRDKICASRKKGIWMGGFPPLGYDVVERKLVPNPTEVKLVRRIFESFIAIGSVTVLVQQLRAEGVMTKSWKTIKEMNREGKLVDKGWLYKLFKNPVVIGIAAYKGKHYPGEHEAILDKAIWDQVQEMLARNDVAQRARINRPSNAPALLKGLIFASDGNAMTPGHTKKGSRYYRYYVNTATMKIGRDACEVTRVAAGDIDAKVVDQVRKILLAPEVIAQAVREVQKLAPETDEQQTIQTLQSIESVWEELFPAEQSRITHVLVDRVVICPTGIRIDMKTDGMKDLVASVLAEPELRKAA